jgi:hypothetical protein
MEGKKQKTPNKQKNVHENLFWNSKIYAMKKKSICDEKQGTKKDVHIKWWGCLWKTTCIFTWNTRKQDWDQTWKHNKI